MGNREVLHLMGTTPLVQLDSPLELKASLRGYLPQDPVRF